MKNNKEFIQAQIKATEELHRLSIENNDPIGSYQYKLRREMLIVLWNEELDKDEQ